MPNKSFERSLTAIVLITLAGLSLTGCSDKEDEGATYSDASPQQTADQKTDNPNDTNVPKPTLAQGQILNVQLVYGVDEKDENNDEWYMVELKRDDSRWHDMVKIQGLGRSAGRHWDDYTFSANNFNWQVEMEQYGTDTLDGNYTLTISGSNGHIQERGLIRKDGQWLNTEPVLTIHVP